MLLLVKANTKVITLANHKGQGINPVNQSKLVM